MKTLKITEKDYILANKIANRDIELEDKTGFESKHKVHKSKKTYTRKSKHKGKDL